MPEEIMLNQTIPLSSLVDSWNDQMNMLGLPIPFSGLVFFGILILVVYRFVGFPDFSFIWTRSPKTKTKGEIGMFKKLLLFLKLAEIRGG